MLSNTTSTLARAKAKLEYTLYIRAGFFSGLVFALSYGYLTWMNLPNLLNKAVADTAVVLIALSMALSGLGYFFNFLDRQVVYRKHIGLIGFGFVVWHLLLSWDAFMRLFQETTWATGKMWPMLTGTIALAVFTIMALISNTLATRLLGGKLWRAILRFGYVGLLFVLGHVFLLKASRWLTWWQEGMQGPPALSLVVSVLIVLAILLRLLLAWSLGVRRRK